MLEKAVDPACPLRPNLNLIVSILYAYDGPSGLIKMVHSPVLAVPKQNVGEQPDETYA